VNVVDFGAQGDDQLDDSEAFAAALKGLAVDGGTVHIPAGTYLFRAGSRSSVGRGIDIFRRSNVILEGEGIGQTILRMAPGFTYNAGTNVILVEQSSGITIRDLTVDGNRAAVTYNDEQSHGIDVHGSSNVRFERVLFTGMHSDGLRLLGLLGSNLTWVEDIRIEECRFADNGRSGIAVQRAVRRVKILRNTFTQISDQSIDMEPSGGDPNIAPRDFEISGNLFFNTDPLGLTISGLSPEDPARNVIVTNNEFDGSGIFIFDAVDVRIEGNSIRSGYVWAPIEMRKGTERVWVVDNDLDSRATESPAIELMFHTSRAPKNIYIIDNRIMSKDYPGFQARDSEALELTGNTISGSGAHGIGIQDINPDSPLQGFLLENNTLSGFDRGMEFVSRGDLMSGVCVRTNTFKNIPEHVRLEGPVALGCIN